MTFQQSIEQIVADRSHGSTWLVGRICSTLALLDGHPDSRRQLHWAMSRLRGIDPSMAVVHHLIRTLVPAIDGDFFTELQRYQLRWDSVPHTIAQHLLRAWPFSDAPILLHSHSELVVTVADDLNVALNGLEVLQTHSLPGGEGELQASRLRALGLRVTLIEDAQVPALASTCQAAVLGVDQYSGKRFVNKVGSAGIVEAMRRCSRPTFVLGDSRKRVRELHYTRSLFESVPFGEHVHLITELGR